MGKYDIGPRLGIDGEAEFRRAIQNINTNIRTLGTEMLAVTSAYDANDRSAAALTARPRRSISSPAQTRMISLR